MMPLSRRSLMGGAILQLLAGTVWADHRGEGPAIGFGFGTYGMKRLSAIDALLWCARIGYDGVELALMPGWPTEPRLLSKGDRQQLRQRFDELGLALPSLLESLPCLRSDEEHRANLEKLKQATQLAHDLAPQRPPVVQSILGGKPADWEQERGRLVDQLSDWASIGQESKTVICFKPHAAHLVHTPARALWLHQQVNSPWLKVVYDYSHFQLEGIPLATSLADLLPVTPYIQIKDSRGTPDDHEYLLPGDGDIDYLELLTILKEAKYSGFVNVEVSSMIHRKPDYDAIATARLCYQRLAPLFDKVGIERPGPG